MPTSRLPALDVHGLVKPVLRGRIHLAALVAAIPSGLWLVFSAAPGRARVAAAMYALSLVLLFGASAAYHRCHRSEAWQRWLRRLDHSSIYVLIAGSYTPICIVLLRGWWGWSLLAAIWVAAIVGVVLKLVLFERTSKVGGALYIVMGWAAVAATPALLARATPSALALLAAGGVLYTLGAIVLATRFPNPFPRVFGYHEVWHTMVVVAGVLHFFAIHDVVTG